MADRRGQSEPAGLWAAIGGLGITVRSAFGLPARLVWHKAMFGLPRLPAFPITLHRQPTATTEGLERLRTLIREAVAEQLPASGTRRASRKVIRPGAVKRQQGSMR